ncbi:MAG TPA: biopolymer transporter ExbD [Verrucomicrobiae bacterium]
MRRFSQRNSLVTLSDINITPLLDLAFVLLIIFVITTPLLEQGINLKLPAGGGPDNQRLDPSNIRTVEVTQQEGTRNSSSLYRWFKLFLLVTPHSLAFTLSLRAFTTFRGLNTSLKSS